MTQRFQVLVLVYALLLTFACTPTEKRDTQATTPNIIFILADDLGWRDVGYQGSTFYETPNLDAIANKGIVFSRAYTNAPNCAPTRASIVSGQYTPRHGIYTVKKSTRGDQAVQALIPLENTEVLDTSGYSIGKMMKGAGYQTAFIGKWHLGNHEGTSPLAHGFDINIGGWERGSPRSYFSPYQNPVLSDGPEGEHLTDRLTTEAMQYVDQAAKASQPYFLYLSYYAVHSPFQAKDSLKQKYQQKTVNDEQSNATYAGMIETLDTNVGRLISYLEQQDMLENTLIVFYSDNGGSWRATSNSPLKGSKGTLYEGGIRVPSWVYAPGLFPKQRSIDTPVLSSDWYTTFAALAKAEIPQDYPVDGANLLPLLNGDSIADRPLYWYFPAYLPGSSYQGKQYAFRTSPASAILKGDYKLIWFYGEEKAELYHLPSDPVETRNLALEDHPQYTVLLEELKRWHSQMGTPASFPSNPNFSPQKAQSYDHLRFGAQ